MKSTQGQIVKVHKPQWTYTVKVRFEHADDGTVWVYLAYANGTPLSDKDAFDFLTKQGWIQE